jgi:hypothetical protein
MSLPLEKTLGAVRSEIQIRLGFGMAGQAGIVNSPLIDSFIRSAQEQLAEQHDWLMKNVVYERPTGTDQQFYDYPPNCAIDGIQSIETNWGGRYLKLTEGIEAHHRNLSPGGPPARYMRRDQIEIWPVPSSPDYLLRFNYNRTLGPLVESSDRLTIPSEIVFLHALATAKAHYRQPDSEVIFNQLATLLNRMKSSHRSKQSWSRVEVNYSPYDVVDSTNQV